MRTNHTLTTALQRTEQRLRSELERSVLSTQLLQSSTSTLRQTSNAQSNFTSLLDTSRGLITALERTDWFDRLLIFLALAVFLGTCVWIVKVRVVDRALRLGFWWVKYLPFPSQGGNGNGNADVAVHGKMEGSSDIMGAVVTTTLASVIAEVTNTALAEAVGAHARGLVEASTGTTMDTLGGNATDANANATTQGDEEPASVASPHRGEL
jgi:protein transport protein SEC20